LTVAFLSFFLFLRWENQYGTANLCSGDNYRRATEKMCLESEALGMHLNVTTGGAPQSVENAIAASFAINGEQLAWGLWGQFSTVNRMDKNITRSWNTHKNSKAETVCEM